MSLTPIETLLRQHQAAQEQHPVSKEQAELETAIGHITDIAHEIGLRPFDTHFQLVPAAKMYEYGAYGLPGRYSHWSQGAAYHRMKTMYDYGLSKIYELVINTNPAQGFLHEGNAPIENKLVVAHVLAHVDFFAQNANFRDTNRKMADIAHLHANRIRQYEYEHGTDEVERFLDAVLAIELNVDAIDLHRSSPDEYVAQGRRRFEEEQKRLNKPRNTGYEDIFELGENPKAEKPKEKAPFPSKPDQDLLWFIANFSPNGLEDWQRDIIEIVRSEALYFAPQMATKIMNEGWATFNHVKILREMGARGYLLPGEDTDWIRLNSGVAAPDPRSINPYYVGWKIWEDIERRYNGETHPGDKKGKNWWGEETEPSYYKGRQDHDVFWVRANIPTDQAFLRNYLTPNLIEELDLYTFAHAGKGEWKITDKNPINVLNTLVASMDNNGIPVIEVAVGGGDYNGNRELYLKQVDNRRPLHLDYAKQVLKAIYTLWGRPVHLEARSKDGRVRLDCDDPTKGVLTEKLSQN